jgi:trimeric autotransporter adhesin
MKKVLLAGFCVLALALTSNAQNKTLGVGASTLNSNAALHVESPTNNQGVLFPRLTTAQRTALTSALTAADQGLMLYDKDLNAVYTWNGTAWVATQLILPYTQSATTAPAGSNLFSLTYGGTDATNVGVAYFETTNPNTAFAPLFVRSSSNVGAGANISINNATNNNSAINASTNGVGRAASFTSTHTTSPQPAVYAITNSTTTSTALSAAVFGETPSAFAGVVGKVTAGFGNGVVGLSTSPESGSWAVLGQNSGNGSAGWFTAKGGANDPVVGVDGTGSGTGLFVRNTSTGHGIVAEASSTGNAFAGLFSNLNAGNTYPAIQASTKGSGPGVRVIQSSTTSGGGVDVTLQNSASTSAGVSVNNQGLGNAANFINTNASSSQSTLNVQTFGTAGSVYVNSNNTGSSFPTVAIDNNGSGNSLDTRTSGTGNALNANHTGATGNIAVFQSNGSNTARIDKTGKGFFNGGTQSSGADVAEMFDVEGAKSSYEPGDVLVISENTDRTVEKSSDANSTRVAGVYATKPGVMLTERDVEASLDDLVPMGVIGVIPTKVCTENGPIKRGDLLVTSSKAGHAMKAIPVNVNGVLIYPTGAILGKALENFDGNDSGLIKVLVNVK